MPELTFRLQQSAHTLDVELAVVENGWEGATWEQRGHIMFWAYSGTAWRRLGSSTYPYPTADGSEITHVVGVGLTGMRHSIFLLWGTFTRDHSRNAVLYTAGPRGWGVVKPALNGHLVPSGQPVGADKHGLWFGATFPGTEPNDHLQTRNCPKAGCGGAPVLRLWQWTGVDFVPIPPSPGSKP